MTLQTPEQARKTPIDQHTEHSERLKTLGNMISRYPGYSVDSAMQGNFKLSSSYAGIVKDAIKEHKELAIDEAAELYPTRSVNSEGQQTATEQKAA